MELDTTFTTVLCGTLVYIFSKVFETCFVEPIKEFKDIKAQIAYDVVYYADVIHNPSCLSKEKYSEATSELRKQAAALKAFSVKKPWWIPYRKNRMQECASFLIGLSNSVDAEWTVEDKDGPIELEKFIKKYVGIKK